MSGLKNLRRCHICQEYGNHWTPRCPKLICKKCDLNGHSRLICPTLFNNKLIEVANLGARKDKDVPKSMETQIEDLLNNFHEEFEEKPKVKQEIQPVKSGTPDIKEEAIENIDDDIVMYAESMQELEVVYEKLKKPRKIPHSTLSFDSEPPSKKPKTIENIDNLDDISDGDFTSYKSDGEITSDSETDLSSESPSDSNSDSDSDSDSSSDSDKSNEGAIKIEKENPAHREYREKSSLKNTFSKTLKDVAEKSIDKKSRSRSSRDVKEENHNKQMTKIPGKDLISLVKSWRILDSFDIASKKLLDVIDSTTNKNPRSLRYYTNPLDEIVLRYRRIKRLLERKTFDNLKDFGELVRKFTLSAKKLAEKVLEICELEMKTMEEWRAAAGLQSAEKYRRIKYLIKTRHYMFELQSNINQRKKGEPTKKSDASKVVDVIEATPSPNLNIGLVEEAENVTEIDSESVNQGTILDIPLPSTSRAQTNEEKAINELEPSVLHVETNAKDLSMLKNNAILFATKMQYFDTNQPQSNLCATSCDICQLSINSMDARLKTTVEYFKSLIRSLSSINNGDLTCNLHGPQKELLKSLKRSLHKTQNDFDFVSKHLHWKSKRNLEELERQNYLLDDAEECDAHNKAIKAIKLKKEKMEAEHFFFQALLYHQPFHLGLYKKLL